MGRRPRFKIAAAVTRGNASRQQPDAADARTRATRLPRMRVTVWSLMAATAVIALVIVYLMRPHPVAWFRFAPGFVWWSDGSRTLEQGPTPESYRLFGPLLKVKWSNGWSSWYLSRKQIRPTFLEDNVANWVATLRSDPRPLAGRRRLPGSRRTRIRSTRIARAELIAGLNDASPRVRRTVVGALYRFVARSTATVPALAKARRRGYLRPHRGRRGAGVRAEDERGEEDRGSRSCGSTRGTKNLVRCRAAKSLVAWGEGQRECRP